MTNNRSHDLVHDLLLPTLLFAVLGGMTWAVRGCSGYGAVNGCMFAGVTWGAAWWFIARDRQGEQSRPYASGWIVLALTIGIGIAGARGWMQWPSFFRGELLINAPTNQTAPISRIYGFIWLFIAGVPWAGLGACMLAWCGSARRTSAGQWAFRIACGVGGVVLARILFDAFPEVFLPLYKTLKSQYLDAIANPKATQFDNLRRLHGDNFLAISHLGLYLGFLLYEVIRRDWRNTTLIVTVGLLNGLGWSACQNWSWAQSVWPGASFNFWRCWESSGGVSIGIALGVAYYLTNRRLTPQESAARFALAHPNLERFALALGLFIGLGVSLKNGLKGWANIYIGNEEYWSRLLTFTIGPLLLLGIVATAIWIWPNRLPKDYRGDLFPHAYALIWLVLILQNILGQLVTGPHTSWSENAFALYYVALFVVSGILVWHFNSIKGRRTL